jgi:CRP-like cAMP-binding protein
MKAETRSFSPRALLAKITTDKTQLSFGRRQVVFAQGDPADAVLYIQRGRIELRVASRAGKEAVLALLGNGDFFGEGCIARQTVRMASATALTECSIVRIGKSAMMQLLRDEPAFSAHFLEHLLSRNIRIEGDLIDQLFNSSEKRLARLLLLLSNFGKEAEPEAVIPPISQETLAAMIGTTRSRVSHFMNKFRRLGFIKYNGGLEVNNSLLNLVLHD